MKPIDVFRYFGLFLMFAAIDLIQFFLAGNPSRTSAPIMRLWRQRSSPSCGRCATVKRSPSHDR